jgi:hypothetical protein
MCTGGGEKGPGAGLVESGLRFREGLRQRVSRTGAGVADPPVEVEGRRVHDEPPRIASRPRSIRNLITLRSVRVTSMGHVSPPSDRGACG